MQYTHLGRTGLSVSRLCLGTMNFGPQTSAAAQEIAASAQSMAATAEDLNRLVGQFQLV